MKVAPGQLVLYDPGYRTTLGKVKRLNPLRPETAFVWYSGGDTASCTDLADLYPIDVRFARRHRAMFDNAYALEDIIKKGAPDEKP